VTQDWETTFAGWTGPASDAEQTRYERTRDRVRDALRAYPALAGYRYDVYAKGSYPNYTNVRADSDVDIAVELTELFHPDFIGQAEGLDLTGVGATPYEGTNDLDGFKDDVERALIAALGATAVDRGTKALHVRESRQGLAADVVACVSHRTYTTPTHHWKGIRLRNDADPGEQLINYPRQHLEMGIAKNERTNKRYKRVVRIVKRLENLMVDEGVIEAVPSFLIESAVFSVPDENFGSASWMGHVQNVLAHIWNGTRDDDCVASGDWMEANNIKYLFHADQRWDHRQAHRFADAAWERVGLPT
jgi:hypothetical protein